MPKLGESITEGTIVAWSVQAGDRVKEDDVLFEVTTAKVSAEVPSPVAGTVKEILHHEGDTVPVGTVVAIIDLSDDDADEEEPQEAAGQQPQAGSAGETAGTAAQPGASGAPQTASAQTVSTGGKEIQGTSAPEQTGQTGAAQASQSAGAPASEQAASGASAKEPPAKETAAGGTPQPESASGAPAVRWYSPAVLQLAKEAGITQEELDRLPGTGFEGRVSKKDMQQYIARKKQQESGSAPQPAAAAPGKETTQTASQQAGRAQPQAGSAGAVSGTQPAASAASPGSSPDGTTPSGTPQPAATQGGSAAGKETPGTSAPAPKASQTSSAQASASSSQHPDKAAATGSAKSPAQASTPAPREGEEVQEMDRIRRIIADRMVQSKQVSPHVTTFVEADVTRLVQWRNRVKDEFKRSEGVALTFLPAVASATARALKEFPRINASVDGYRIILKKRINLGIAVSLPDGNLIVPVIPDADRLNLAGLAARIDELASKARAGKLSPDEMSGGTFTITNFGSFRNLFATPIINQPEVAILGTGYIEKKPAVVETPEGDAIAIRNKMFLSLSYDHRIVDGALGGAFLRRIADLLENWNE